MIDPKDDGAVIFEESPIRSVDFAPRVVRSGHRGSFSAAALVVALAGLIGLGLFAGRAGFETGPEAVTVPEAAAASGPSASEPSSGWGFAVHPSPSPASGSRVPTWPPSRGFVYVGGVVDLRSPVPSTVDQHLTSIDVEGTVLVRAARIDITLQSGSARIIDRTSIDVRDLDGGVRPVRAPTFMTSFDLPAPRTGETLWVVVTAYDESGAPIGATRRPIFTGRQPGA